jgi:phenylalanyl-tRNA synthetase beta chain
MKVALSWLKEFVPIEADTAELSRRLSVAGLEVEGVERVAPAFAGVVIGKVLKVQKHPDAERLNLCEVDAGAGEHFSVVCGAPNVTAGMIAPFARVGAKLGGKEGGTGANGTSLESVPPLEAAVIRGVRSEGMLCSERELGFSDDHTGIMSLDSDAPLGTDLTSYLGIEDTVLDIAITPNRGDCLSILGVAREIAALFDLKLKLPNLDASKLKPPSSDGSGTSPSVELLAADLCPRYAALAMNSIRIGISPLSIRRRLALCGMRPLNNVVDITNYVMLELGQPLHAFDFTKLDGGKIIVRRAGDDREFVTLDQSSRRLESSDLVIADQNKPLAIAGIMGGLNSEVSESTNSILLESAYFDPITIARTGRRLGLRSEASYRFERSVDRAGQVAALVRAAELIRKFARGRESAALIDVQPQAPSRPEIELSMPRLSALLGVEIPAAEVKRRLQSLGMKVSAAGKNKLAVVAPSFRPDLKEFADLAEEVARVNGIEDVPAVMPPRAAGATAKDHRRSFIGLSRELMLGCGLTEIKTLAFASPQDNRTFPGLIAAPAVVVTNPLSAELSELRQSLIPGLIAALQFNLNRQAEAFHAFEIAKVFYGSDSGAAEGYRIAGIGYGQSVFAGIGHPGIDAGFFTIKGVLETYFEAVGIGKLVEFARAEAVLAPYLHPGKAASIMASGRTIGFLGELHPREALRLGIANQCALFELDFAYLIAYRPPLTAVAAPPRFPAVRRDMALVLDRGVLAKSALQTVTRIDAPLLESVELFDAYEGGSVPAGKKSLALACRYRAKDRTLTDEEVNRAHAKVVEQTLASLGAELRK